MQRRLLRLQHVRLVRHRPTTHLSSGGELSLLASVMHPTGRARRRPASRGAWRGRTDTVWCETICFRSIGLQQIDVQMHRIWQTRGRQADGNV